MSAFALALETARDAPAIDALHETVFGRGWQARPAARLRQNIAYEPGCSFTAWQGLVLVGSVRITPMAVGAAPVWLLGPLAVQRHLHGQGVGAALMKQAKQASQALEAVPILLVGEMDYYGRFGFHSLAGRVTLLEELPTRILGWGPRVQQLSGSLAPR